MIIVLLALCTSTSSTTALVPTSTASEWAKLNLWRRTMIRLCESDEDCKGDNEQCLNQRCGPAPRSRWYGWQPLLTDAIGVQLVVVGLAVLLTQEGKEDAISVAGGTAAAVGLADLVFVPPIIHLLNTDRWVRSIVSFSIRGVAAAAALGLFSVAATCNEHLCGFLPGFGSIIIAAIGTAAASVIDAIVARDPIEDSSE